jgi:hypothetical protein
MRRSFFTLLVACAAVFLVSGTALAQQKFVAHLDSAQEVPSTASTGNGVCVVTLNAAETSIDVACSYTGLTSNLQADHIHANAAPGVNAGILFGFGVTGGTSGTFNAGPFAVTPAQVANMRAHLWYINLHSVNFPGGEIRGQVKQAHTVFDLDGDGRTDITVFRQTANSIYTLQSLTNTLAVNTFGSGAGDTYLTNMGDFDGDGRGDPVIIKFSGVQAVWSILQTATNTVRSVLWGDFSAAAGDRLACADYDGDGKQDVAVYRRSTATFCIIQSSTLTQRFEVWGSSAGFPATPDEPSVGDYDGDGRTDLCIVRNEGGNRVWYIKQSSTGTLRAVFWGQGTDGVFFFAPVDVDGDGKQDLATNRPGPAPGGTQRTHFILRSSDGQPQITVWGPSAAGNVNLYGDYDGDGKTDIVSRSVVGGVMTWNILQSSNGVHRSVNWGTTGDQ